VPRRPIPPRHGQNPTQTHRKGRRSNSQDRPHTPQEGNPKAQPKTEVPAPSSTHSRRGPSLGGRPTLQRHQTRI